MLIQNSKEARRIQSQSSEHVTREGVLEGSTCPAFEAISEGSGTGTHIGNFSMVSVAAFPGWAGPVHMIFILGLAATVSFFLVFPNGRIAPRGALVIPVHLLTLGWGTLRTILAIASLKSARYPCFEKS